MSPSAWTGTVEPGPAIAAFERLDFDHERFDQVAHVCVAWSYLQSHDLLASIERYRATLKRFTRKLGVRASITRQQPGFTS